VPLSQFVQPFVNRKRAASETSERACVFHRSVAFFLPPAPERIGISG
jgi:hypothetical protein